MKCIFFHIVNVGGDCMEELMRYWEDIFTSERNQQEHWWERKSELCSRRNAEIVRIKGNIKYYRMLRYDKKTYYEYMLHVMFLINQKDFFYIEEQIIPYVTRIHHGEIVEHKHKLTLNQERTENKLLHPAQDDNREELRFVYDRRAAVQYAERWWNSYNPKYRTFDVDCTNYVSQCLHAGGAPMYGSPDRAKGWWYENDHWSYSWSVSHSLRWYLSGSTKGMQGKEVDSADQLMPGDVICYDFQGNGRFDHSTIVVAKDADNFPLVNAHTDNSRHRYWSYEDSTAWTPDIQYKFFQII